jgi:tetratricopeptide (TPR) repeat protein
LDLLADIAVAQARAGDVAGSGETFARALKAASEITDPREHYHALLGIAVSQAKAGSADAAAGTSALAASPERRAAILGIVAATLSEAGDSRHAMIVATLIPDEYREQKSAAICGVASDMAARGECSQALTLLEKTKVDMAHGHELLLKQQAGAALPPAEKTTVGEAVSKAMALLEVARCHARAGRFAEAARVAETIGFGCFRDRALRYVASIAVDAGDLEAGRRIASRILDKKDKDLALADLAVGEAAKGFLNESLKTVGAIARPAIKGDTMIRIAVVLAQSGNNAAAKKTLLDAEKDQVEPAARAAAETVIARAFAEHGDFTSAEGMVETLADHAARAQIMAAMGGAYAKTGRTADAHRTFERACQCALRIRSPYEATRVLRGVAASRGAAGDHSGAARTLQEAARIAATIPAEGGTNVIALQEVAVAQAKSGDQAAAGATFHAALNAAKACADEDYAAILSQDVMKARTECGDAETALEAANRLEPGVIKCRSLLGIALALLEEPEGEPSAESGGR